MYIMQPIDDLQFGKHRIYFEKLRKKKKATITERLAIIDDGATNNDDERFNCNI